MTRTLFTLGFFLAPSLYAAEQQSQNEEVTVAPTRAELQQRLLEAFKGEYSNFAALTEHPTTVGDFPPIIQRAEIVQLATGEEALLVNQGFLSARGLPLANAHYRRTLYVFVTPRNSDALVQVSYPLDPSISKETLTQLGALELLERLPGCEIHWQYEALDNGQDSFNGYRNPARCFFLDDESVPVHLETILHVSNNEIQMTENLLDSAGEPLIETELGGTMTLSPIRFFEMTVSFLPDGAKEEDADAWINIQPDGLIHDHGQRINLLTKKEQQALPYQIKLERAVNNNNQLLVRIYSLGSEMPLQDLAVDLTDGIGVLNADPLRVEIQIRP